MTDLTVVRDALGARTPTLVTTAYLALNAINDFDIALWSAENVADVRRALDIGERAAKRLLEEIQQCRKAVTP